MRRTVPVLALLLGGLTVRTGQAQSPSADSAGVLFICEHGNVKSLLAATWFNALASAQGLTIRAYSRGEAPNSTTVPAPILEGLRRDGFAVEGFTPTALSRRDLENARRVITIGISLPDALVPAGAHLESWDDVPPATIDYAAAREALLRHLRPLVLELKSGSSPP